VRYPIGQAVITRRCNLSCEQCRWTSGDYQDRSFREWRPYLDWLLENSHHVLLIGGEPTVHGDFEKFVAYLAGKGASFSVASNSVFVTRDDLWQWYDLGLYNWSVSVDSLEDVRGKAGWRALGVAQRLGYRDLHANVTLSRANLGAVLQLVREITRKGVWAEVGTLAWGKGPGYDVWPDVSHLAVEEGEELDRVCAALSVWAKEDLLAHNREEGYFQDVARYAPTMSWRCDRPALILDADCRLRLCRDVRGWAVPALEPLMTSDVEWIDAWKRDVGEFCRGCFWDCHWAVCYWGKCSFQEGGELFSHGHRA